jgi:hypothetical protein
MELRLLLARRRGCDVAVGVLMGYRAHVRDPRASDRLHRPGRFRFWGLGSACARGGAAASGRIDSTRGEPLIEVRTRVLDSPTSFEVRWRWSPVSDYATATARAQERNRHSDVFGRLPFVK